MQTSALCTATTKAGAPCRAVRKAGLEVCAFHDRSPEARARHLEISAKGGRRHSRTANAAPVPAMSEDPAIAALDLTTLAGIRDFTAAAVRGLSRLPLDARLANAITGLVTAQRSTLDGADLEERVAALEAQQGLRQLRAG